MTDVEILSGIKKYFSIQELVGPETYVIHGESSWRFVDIRLLEALLIIRVNINKPITINNWNSGGNNSQRGLRTNVQSIFSSYFNRKKLYLSGHVLGKAVDFDVDGMTAEEVRNWIDVHGDLFPFKIRLEANVSWVHLDVIQDESKPKVYLFVA